MAKYEQPLKIRISHFYFIPKKSHKRFIKQGCKKFDWIILYIQMVLQTKLLPLAIKYTIYTYANRNTTNT